MKRECKSLCAVICTHGALYHTLRQAKPSLLPATVQANRMEGNAKVRPAVPGRQPGPAPLCSAPHEAPSAPNSQCRQSKAVSRQQSTRAVSAADRQREQQPLCLLSWATAARSLACKSHTAYRTGTKSFSPINPFLAISTVKCLVIFSSSCSCARTTKHSCYYRPK